MGVKNQDPKTHKKNKNYRIKVVLRCLMLYQLSV